MQTNLIDSESSTMPRWLESLRPYHRVTIKTPLNTDRVAHYLTQRLGEGDWVLQLRFDTENQHFHGQTETGGRRRSQSWYGISVSGMIKDSGDGHHVVLTILPGQEWGQMLAALEFITIASFAATIIGFIFQVRLSFNPWQTILPLAGLGLAGDIFLYVKFKDASRHIVSQIMGRINGIVIETDTNNVYSRLFKLLTGA